ncbi:hypothetical protein CALCODRAFT_494527 [Calocera cornea HHB12733]|uniref:Uncharacterized protein n=1 Tax=Calocera cornea HHB12733 TaxID=1353952 RepID=A0A165H3P8_9BASI|nr:hypothetical protein CALCODRAFT_494527 [Calocera cornea HHB12733]
MPILFLHPLRTRPRLFLLLSFSQPAEPCMRCTGRHQIVIPLPSSRTHARSEHAPFLRHKTTSGSAAGVTGFNTPGSRSQAAAVEAIRTPLGLHLRTEE